MADTFGFFDGSSYTAAQWDAYVKACTTPGVALGVGNALVVTAGPGLGVTIDTGYGLILGQWFNRSASAALALPHNATGGVRRDVIVLRLNLSGSTWGNTLNNTLGLDFHVGTSPVAPALTQTSTQYEIPLAWADVSTLDVVTVTDKRQYLGQALHDIVSAHTASGLTNNQVLAATGAGTFGFVPLAPAHVNVAPAGWAWATWTPTFTQGVGVTFTTTLAHYLLLGKIAIVQFYLNPTSNGTIGSVITIGGIPAAIAPLVAGVDVGAFRYADVSAGTYYVGVVTQASATQLQFYVHNSTAALGASPSFGAGNTDVLSGFATWEVA